MNEPNGNKSNNDIQYMKITFIWRNKKENKKSVDGFENISKSLHRTAGKRVKDKDNS